MGHGPKIISAKFHPNPLIIKTAFQAKTDKPWLTPQQYGGRFAMCMWGGARRGGASPLWWGLRDHVGGIGVGGASPLQTTL